MYLHESVDIQHRVVESQGRNTQISMYNTYLPEIIGFIEMWNCDKFFNCYGLCVVSIYLTIASWNGVGSWNLNQAGFDNSLMFFSWITQRKLVHVNIKQVLLPSSFFLKGLSSHWDNLKITKKIDSGECSNLRCVGRLVCYSSCLCWFWYSLSLQTI